MARVGAQAGAEWKFVSRSPFSASASRWGADISPPKEPRSEKPISSATITRKFGRFPIAPSPIFYRLTGPKLRDTLLSVNEKNGPLSIFDEMRRADLKGMF